MPRELVDVQHNRLKISDASCGEVIELHYRLPTTEERVAYQRACLLREGKKVRFDANPARLKYGLLILTGFAEGAFAAGGQPISADPAAENYRADWKELVKKTASDLVSALAMVVFEGIRIAGDTPEVDFAGEIEAEADGIEKAPVEGDTLTAGGEAAEPPLASS